MLSILSPAPGGVACVLSHVRLFGSSWTVAHQAPLSMEFSREEYWSGLPFPSPGDLPDPEIKLASLASPALAGRFFATVARGEAFLHKTDNQGCQFSASW